MLRLFYTELRAREERSHQFFGQNSALMVEQNVDDIDDEYFEKVCDFCVLLVVLTNDSFFILLRSESPSGKCAKRHTVAASNHSDNVPQSLFA